MSETLSDTLIQIDALGTSGPYRSRQRMLITEVNGTPVAELSLVPVPYVSRAMTSLRKSKPLPRQARLAAIARAGEAFLHDTISGLSAEAYQHHVARISGLSITEVRSAAQKIAAYASEAWERAQFARPAGVAETLDDPRVNQGAGVWVRKGQVFAVHAAGNHPAIHGGWLEALALGYRVAVRPSRREPLTPWRLITALHEAGIGKDQLVFLPSDYAAADEIIFAADLAMVYGGAEVIKKYQGTTLFPQGPGRSKMLISASENWSTHLDRVVESVSRGGGTGCTNATSLLIEGDYAQAEAFASALAERLNQLPSLPPEDENAVLPVQHLEDALRIEGYLLETAQGAKALLGGNGIVDELGDGSAVMRPAVHLLSGADKVQSQGIELAFPCVWVAPWQPSDGLTPLQNTLNLVLVGAQETLAEAALDDPSIRNVYQGAVRSYFSAPHMPHDGYLAEFLMKPKGFVHWG